MFRPAIALLFLSTTTPDATSRHSSLNSQPVNLLQPLCRRQKSQLLWNQANPASFCKTPGLGVPRFPLQPPTAHYPLLTTHSHVTPFKINTRKSVSKQRTLTLFRINT